MRQFLSSRSSENAISCGKPEDRELLSKQIMERDAFMRKRSLLLQSSKENLVADDAASILTAARAICQSGNKSEESEDWWQVL